MTKIMKTTPTNLTVRCVKHSHSREDAHKCIRKEERGKRLDRNTPYPLQQVLIRFGLLLFKYKL